MPHCHSHQCISCPFAIRGSLLPTAPGSADTSTPASGTEQLWGGPLALHSTGPWSLHPVPRAGLSWVSSATARDLGAGEGDAVAAESSTGSKGSVVGTGRAEVPLCCPSGFILLLGMTLGMGDASAPAQPPTHPLPQAVHLAHVAVPGRGQGRAATQPQAAQPKHCTAHPYLISIPTSPPCPACPAAAHRLLRPLPSSPRPLAVLSPVATMLLSPLVPPAQCR